VDDAMKRWEESIMTVVRRPNYMLKRHPRITMFNHPCERDISSYNNI